MDARYASLKGRPVFISGGASGIGEGLVRAFAEQGARVAFVDIATTQGENLAAELGGDVFFAPCDVTDTVTYQAAIHALAQKTGPFRVLLNNAANDERHGLETLTPEYFDGRVAVNFKHMFFAAQAVLPGMVAAGGGSVINFGSTSWMLPSRNLPVYAALKAGVHGMSRALAKDHGKMGVRFNTLLPGWTMTQRQLDLWFTPESDKEIDANQLLPGRVMPVDIAAMALFLASEDSRMITGQEFIVDAGWV
jgi:D-xylose 1-dehydrogenase